MILVSLRDLKTRKLNDLIFTNVTANNGVCLTHKCKSGICTTIINNGSKTEIKKEKEKKKKT